MFGTEQPPGLYCSSLVYLPAVLAQVTRLKHGKKEREEKQLVVGFKPSSAHICARAHTPTQTNAHVHTSTHTQKDVQFLEEIHFARGTTADHTESQFRGAGRVQPNSTWEHHRDTTFLFESM